MWLITWLHDITKNLLNTGGSSSDNNVNSVKVNDKIVNLLNSVKKMSSRVDFFIFKASLTFTQLMKVFIKALILYYFDLE